MTVYISMVEWNKNHPSIIVWSLGNESGFGRNHQAISKWIRENEPILLRLIRFVIILLKIDVPDIILLWFILNYIVNGSYGGHH